MKLTALADSEQSTLSLGYLGPPGTHSHQAAMLFIASLSEGGAVRPEPYPSFYRLLEAIEQQTVDIAVVPVENGLEGSVIEVTETLGLEKRRLKAHAEFLIPIVHALIQSVPGPVQHVMSHPQALGQCRETLYRLFGDTLETHPMLSTSEAVQALGQKPAGWAAIGTAHAAALYDFPVSRENISDAPDNQTRFLVLTSRQSSLDFPQWRQYPQKTSLCLALSDRPGILAEVLWELKQAGINLSRIESRPSKRRFGEYYFYIDVADDLEQPGYEPIRTFLREAAAYLNQTGPYACLGLMTDQQVKICHHSL